MATDSAAKIISTDQRRLRRLSHSGTSDFTCEIHAAGEILHGMIVDYTCEGLGIELASDSTATMKPKDHIDSVIVRYGKKEMARIESATVSYWRSSERRLGLNLDADEKNRLPTRNKERFQLNIRTHASIMADDPIAFGQTLYFKIEDASLDGFRATTSMSNRHLLPSMKIEKCNLILPTVGIFQATIEIRHIKERDGQLYVGLKLVNADAGIREQLGRYILNSCLHGVNNSREFQALLKKAELSYRRMGQSLRIEPVNDASLYREVLEVRYSAYKQAGKVDEAVTAEGMADEYDLSSVNHIARVNGVAVSSFRLSFSRSETEPFPFEKYFPLNTIGDVKRSEIFEVCRLAISPEFQRTDIARSLFRYIAVEGAKNKKYLAILATKSLRPMYERIGAKVISSEVPHPVLPDDPMALLLLPVENYVKAKNLSAEVWENIYKDSVDHLHAFGFIGEKPSRARHFFMLQIERLMLAAAKKRKKRAA